MRKIQKPIGNPNDPESLYYYLLRFLEWCKVQHLSPRTIEGREVFIGKFIQWCDDRGLAHPADITKPILERYQRHLFLQRKPNGQPLGAVSQSNYMICIRSYFKWLAKSNHILYNPASDIELPRRPKRLPQNILTAAEADSIMNQTDMTSATGIRDRAVMEVFYSTGIRRKELTQLKTTDIDIERGTLMVISGKGDKDRMIPIGKRAIKWVEKYLYEVRPRMVVGLSENYLFLNRFGQIMGVTWLSKRVGEYIKAADINKTGSCHVFRHSMATLMLENGAGMRYIQMMLGHASMTTTQLYTQVSITKLKEIHTTTHPANHERIKEVETDITSDASTEEE
jgi:integrase/recombinase XerD